MTLGVAARYTPENQILPNPPITADLTGLWTWAQDMTRTLQQNLGNIARKANDTSTYPLTGDLNANGHNITNVGTITFQSGSAPWVLKTGDTMTGNLTVNIGAASIAFYVLNNNTGAGALINSGATGNTSLFFDSSHTFNIVKDSKANISGGTFAAPTVLWTIDASGNITDTGKLTTATPASGQESFIIPHGAAPSSPTNGSIWSTTAAFFGRVNGATKTVAVLETAQTWAATQTISAAGATPWIWSNTTPATAAAIAVGNGGGTNIYFSGGNYTLRTESTANILNGSFATNVQRWNMDSSGNVTMTGNLNIATGTNYQRNAVNIPFQSAFESSQQTITAAGSLTLAHGLGVQPKLYQAFIVCQTAEGGYSIGDETIVDPGWTADSAIGRGISMVPDATNINVRFGSNGQNFIVVNKTTGANFNITNANWKLVVRAWA